MKSLHLISCLGLALGACSQGALPNLPEDSVESVPTTLRVVQAPETLVAGAWSALSVEVHDQLGAVMPGQTISVAVEAQGADLGLVPPLGNACTTGLAGEACDLVLRSEGPMGTYAVLLTSGNVPPVRLEIEVLPAAADAVFELRIPGRPALRFRNGERDVLSFEEPVDILASGDPVAVELRLSDRHGNPISALIQAQTRSPQPEPVTPLPRPDAGALDAAPADASIAQDVTPGDASVAHDITSADAAPADALVAEDAAPAPLDASAGDATSQPADAGTPSETPLTLSLGANCQGSRSASDQAMPDAQGRVVLCIAGGSAIGPAQLLISVPGVLRVEDDQGGQGDALTLRTNTLPAGQLRLVVSGEPLLSCAAGEATNSLVLSVLDNAEPPHPVPGQLVRTSFAGLVGVTPESAVSGVDGRVSFSGLCPARRSQSLALTAYLANDPAQELSFEVEVQVGDVAVVVAQMLNRPGDPMLRIGNTGTFQFRLLDARGNTVPEGAVSLTLPEVLAGSIVLARAACGAEPGASLNGLTCVADGNGLVELEVRAGGALPGVPVTLVARGHNAGGDDPETRMEIDLRSGQAAQLSTSPAGRIAAVVGADAGVVSVRISDAGGNPVPGVEVRAVVPAEVLLAPQDQAQATNAEGLATWRIAQVQQAGAHTVRFTASILAQREGEEPLNLAAELVLDTSAGQASGLALRNQAGELVVPDDVEGAWLLEGVVGEELPGVYTLTRINGRGGVMAGAGGLALEVLSQPSNGCAALANLASTQFNEAGALRIGEDLELVLGTAARRCRYRLSASGVAQELVIVQRAGTPVGGSFEVNVGSLAEPIWQAAPQRLDPRPGYNAPPGGLPLDQTHHLRIRNPQDAFGNALTVPTALQPAVVNGFASPEVPVLRTVGDDTAVEFAVAGGAALGEDAVVTASSRRGWEQAPVVRFESLQQPPSVGRIGVVGIDRKVPRHPNGSITASPLIGRVSSDHGDPRDESAMNVMAQGETVGIDRFAEEDRLYRPDQLCENCTAEEPSDDLQFWLAAEHEAHAQLVKVSFYATDRVQFERFSQAGACLAGGRCSQAVITWVHDGLRALDRAQVLGRFPLRKVLDDDGQTTFHAFVPVAILSGGGTFGAAIESETGDGSVLVSNTQTFRGVLRSWLRPRQLKVLAPPPPAGVLEYYDDRGELPANWQGFARILDVQRIQADEDDDEELLICGDDAFGGWVAIAHVDEARAAHGANPFGDVGTVQAVRTYFARGFWGDPQANGELSHILRFVTGSVVRPSGCSYVGNSPMGNMILSFGRPGSYLYPGLGDLIATPVRYGAPLAADDVGLAARRLPLGGDRTQRGKELTWGRWQTQEGAVAEGPVVVFADNRVLRFAATLAGEGLALSGATETTLGQGQLLPAQYGNSFDLDFDGILTRSDCYDFFCLFLGRQGIGVEIDRSVGRLIGATDWGGVQGLLRFTRFAPYIAWYLPHRYTEGCRGINGRMVCPQARCGDGQLSYGEVCEQGDGCTNGCRLVGYENERPPSGLTVSFAPMNLQDNSSPEPEVVLSRALAVAPLAHRMNPSTGAMLQGHVTNFGLSWQTWTKGRANCRRLGGDLPSERQWEGFASGGFGGYELGPRRYPWGQTGPALPGIVLNFVRSGRSWLNTTPEGLADLTSRSVEMGEYVLSDGDATVSGVNPQTGPTTVHSYVWKGGGYTRSEVAVRSRLVGTDNGNPGRSRCVWHHNFP